MSDILGISFARTFAPLMSTRRPPRSAMHGLSVARTDFGGWPVYTLQKAAPIGTAVVAIHGGGFTVEATRLHWHDYADIARHTGATVVVPIYPLIPRGNAANVVPQLADLISSVTDRSETKHIGVYGDSAGATLALAATQELVRRGRRVPDSVVLISPWLDLSLSNPDCEGVPDPVLGLDELRQSGR
ncbi:MAG TPA: alpha/beta hydrolase, partial [Mycobacterium sp.]|nr:alpha/beta hydrolase [Mycobacterium sp.]